MFLVNEQVWQRPSFSHCVPLLPFCILDYHFPLWGSGAWKEKAIFMKRSISSTTTSLKKPPLLLLITKDIKTNFSARPTLFQRKCFDTTAAVLRRLHHALLYPKYQHKSLAFCVRGSRCSVPEGPTAKHQQSISSYSGSMQDFLQDLGTELPNI